MPAEDAMYSPTFNLQKRGPIIAWVSCINVLACYGTSQCEPSGFRMHPTHPKVCSYTLERQLRCTVDDGSAAPLWHANKHRSHLKAALIRDAICSLENYKQGHGADMRGHD